jgi:hypothetical protein
MPDQCNPNADPDRPPIYRIRVRGHLGQQWSGWFESLSITLHANGDTLLSGSVADQAAPHGLLKGVRDGGLTLISVNLVAPQAADASNGSR